MENLSVDKTEQITPDEPALAATNAEFESDKTENIITDSVFEPTADTKNEANKEQQLTPSADAEQKGGMEVLSVKFNHKQIDLPLDKARELAQKGMLAEPVMEKLKSLAKANSCTLSSYVDKLVKADEECYKRDILNRTLGDAELADELYAARLNAGTNREPQIEEQQALHSRLADEFLVLQKNMPEITGIDSVPDSVLTMAVKDNIPLFDAFLRHRYFEEQKISEQNKTERENSKASAGSLANRDNTTLSPEVSAMLKGIFG